MSTELNMPQCLRYSLYGFALAVARARRSLLHLFPSIVRSSLKNISTAVKSKDVGKIQEFSSYVSPADSADLPAESADMLRETKRKLPRKFLSGMTKSSVILRVIPC